MNDLSFCIVLSRALPHISPCEFLMLSRLIESLIDHPEPMDPFTMLVYDLLVRDENLVARVAPVYRQYSHLFSFIPQ
jgi:hypothetical protein